MSVWGYSYNTLCSCFTKVFYLIFDVILRLYVTKDQKSSVADVLLYLLSLLRNHNKSHQILWEISPIHNSKLESIFSCAVSPFEVSFYLINYDPVDHDCRFSIRRAQIKSKKWFPCAEACRLWHVQGSSSQFHHLLLQCVVESAGWWFPLETSETYFILKKKTFFLL